MTQEDKAKAYDELINDIKRIIFNHEGAKLYNLIEKNNGLNPYSGVAFKYNDHTWGMRARDNGVDILLDNRLIRHFDKPSNSILKAINEEKVDNANKVEPKFKVGDWIINKTNNSVYQVIGYENNIYRIRKPDCVYYQLLSAIDETYRLWTIKDAKDGDVIVTGFGNIFIFKEIRDCTIYDYCGLYYGKINIYPSHVNEACATKLPTNYTPVAKEQYDLLIKSLNAAGYTFDFKNKELKKITNINKKVILYPFDKVLVRDSITDKWEADFITDILLTKKYPYRCAIANYKECIPYNKDTFHLLDTTDKSPIKYKIKFNKEFK